MVRFTPGQFLTLALRLTGQKDDPAPVAHGDRAQTQLGLAPPRGGFAGLAGSAPGAYMRPAAGRHGERVALWAAEEQGADDVAKDEEMKAGDAIEQEPKADDSTEEAAQPADEPAEEEKNEEAKKADPDTRVLDASRKRVASAAEAASKAAERVAKIADDLNEREANKTAGSPAEAELREVGKTIRDTVKDVATIAAERVGELAEDLSGDKKDLPEIRDEIVDTVKDVATETDERMEKFADDVNKKFKKANDEVRAEVSDKVVKRGTRRVAFAAGLAADAAERLAKLADYATEQELKRASAAKELREIRKNIRATVKDIAMMTAERVGELSDGMTEQEEDEDKDDAEGKSSRGDRYKRYLDVRRRGTASAANVAANTAKRVAKLSDYLTEQDEKRGAAAAEAREIRKTIRNTVKDIAMMTAERVRELSDELPETEPKASKEDEKAVEEDEKTVDEEEQTEIAEDKEAADVDAEGMSKSDAPTEGEQ